MYTRIKVRMAQLDVNYSWLAKQSGLSKQRVQQFMMQLRKREGYNMSTLEKILKALNLRIKIKLEEAKNDK